MSRRKSRQKESSSRMRVRLLRPVAGEVFSSVNLPERHVIFCPNHTGWAPMRLSCLAGHGGCRGATSPSMNPCGSPPRRLPSPLERPVSAHPEHSLECNSRSCEGSGTRSVSFPWRWAPSRFRTAGRWGSGRIRGPGRPLPALLIASSDMTHYEPDATARKKDEKAISRILALDPEGLYKTVRSEKISMCGVIAATLSCSPPFPLAPRKPVW